MSKLITGMSKNRQVRIYVADTTDIAHESVHIHKFSPMSAVINARVITAAVMMGMMSKIDEEQITLQLKGSGDAGMVVAVADTHGNVKSYMTNPLAETVYNQSGGLDISASLGKTGQVIVVRDIGRGEPFVGMVDFASGEIAEDIAKYFAQSEQIRSAVALGATLSKQKQGIGKSGGFIIQLLPDADDDTVKTLEDNIGKLGSLTNNLELGKSIESIANEVMGELGLDELETYQLRLKCNSSKEKVAEALLSLSKEELLDMAREDGGVEVTCHFCQEIYRFTKEEIINLSDASEYVS